MHFLELFAEKIFHEFFLLFVENFQRFYSVLGSFVNCIREANQSAQKLLDIIVTNFSHFKDEAVYQNIPGIRVIEFSVTEFDQALDSSFINYSRSV